MGKMMKRTLAGVLLAAVVLAGGATKAFTAEPGTGTNFADGNGDGVCDYWGNDCQHVDANVDGICDNCGRNQKERPLQNDCGGNYVDQGNDGICDHAGNRGRYADPDRDGICDHTARRGQNKDYEADKTDRK